jgi:hypothetical protein
MEIGEAPQRLVSLSRLNDTGHGVTVDGIRLSAVRKGDPE